MTELVPQDAGGFWDSCAIFKFLPNQVQADLISCSKSNREEQAGGCCVLLLVCGITCLLEEKEGGSESFLKKPCREEFAAAPRRRLPGMSPPRIFSTSCQPLCVLCRCSTPHRLQGAQHTTIRETLAFLWKYIPVLFPALNHRPALLLYAV